ncbi:MAG: hypothetical protein JOZ49_21085 [Mycolicibacterium sp.]|nr:hypothetical protein [Mycolicibacterium sp.]
MAENKTNGAPRLDSTAVQDGSVDGAAAAEALAMAEEAEAEAAEAEALAIAARARARAIRLRRQARSAVTAAPAKGADNDGQTASDDDETAGGDAGADGGDGEVAGGGADSGDGETATATATEVAVALPEDAKDGGADSVELPLIADRRSGADAERRAAEPPGSAEARRSWRPVLSRVLSRRVLARVALGLTVVLIIGLLAVSGVMMWQHHRAAAARHRSAEFAAAARQGVVSLMTMDFNHGKDDVQRVIDNSTGQFRDDFQSRADDFIKAMQESKAVTKVTVNSSAVKSMSDNTADVLVYATSEVTNAAGAQNEPRAFRLNVSMARDGGQIKMSNVELVP